MRSDRMLNLLTALYLLCVPAVGLLVWKLGQSPRVVQLPCVDVLNGPEKALDLSVSVVNLLISLSTGSLAVCGWLLRRPSRSVHEFRERLLWVSSSMLCSCCSIYFGYVAVQGTLTLLRHNTFDPHSPLIWWPHTLQYYLFLASILLFGLSVLRSIDTIRDKG